MIRQRLAVLGRPAVAGPSLSSAIKVGLRKNHTLPEIAFDKSEGVPGLLSAKGLDIAWFKYQQHLLDNVNRLVANNENYQQAKTIFDVMTQALAMGPDAENREIAYYASQAYSNEFFFTSIRASANPNAIVGPEPLKDTEEFSSEVLNLPIVETASTQDATPARYSFRVSVAASLADRINEAFDSPLSFRELLVNRADAMFGNGYVWMVYHDPSLSLVNSYNWASPHASEGAREGDSAYEDLVNIQNTIRSFHPVLAVNAWQHTYLHDYGVAGKRRYLRNVFDCLDWNIVASRIGSSKVYHNGSASSYL